MKINIAVLFGGRSVEHEVSVISASQAMYALNKEKYHIIPVYITKKNEFYTGEALLDIQRYKDIPAMLADCSRVFFSKEADGAYLKPYEKKLFQKDTAQKIDVVLPVVHGTNVEDGTLQGFLEMLEVPYAGCDVTASAVGMDKYVMKTVLKDAQIPVLDCVCFYSKQYYQNPDEILAKIEAISAYPVIVKPANLGSSVGIQIAKDRAALNAAIENAAAYAPKILVERAVTSMREINCSVLGDYEEARASVLEEPVSGDEILSYADKYMHGGKKQSGMSGSEKRLPADLPADTTEEIRQIAIKTFQAVGASGVARIDFIIDTDENKVYVNEINTIPGSLSFYLWEEAGLPFDGLLDELVSLALKRNRERANLNFSYDTNLLSAFQTGGLKGAKGK